MNVALTIWDGRISPVFDTAQELLVVQIEDEQVVARHHEPIMQHSPLQRVTRLQDLNVEVLICGAVSRPLADMLVASNIQLIPFVAGYAEETLAAWLRKELPGTKFLMPGCCITGRRYQRRRGTTQENYMMNGRKGGAGRGMGGGKGGGRGGGEGRGRGRGQGRMGGPVAGGPIGNCICPQCNEQVAHQRGVPCSAQTCPKCGTALVRSN